MKITTNLNPLISILFIGYLSACSPSDESKLLAAATKKSTSQEVITSVVKVSDQAIGNDVDVGNNNAKGDQLIMPEINIIEQVVAAPEKVMNSDNGAALDRTESVLVDDGIEQVADKIASKVKPLTETDTITKAAQNQAVIIDEAVEVKAETPVASINKSGVWVKKSQKIKGSWTIETRDGVAYLVLSDDFKTRKAPDLKFVLSRQAVSDVKSRNAMNDVLLVANLKSASGAQEYRLPESFSDYPTLLLHCEKYTKLWGAADIH